MPLEDGSALACEQGSTNKLLMGSKGRTDEKACFAEAIAASRLRCKERLVACVKALPEIVNQQDGEGAFPSEKELLCTNFAFYAVRKGRRYSI